jgi:hypothetical protein
MVHGESVKLMRNSGCVMMEEESPSGGVVVAIRDESPDGDILPGKVWATFVKDPWVVDNEQTRSMDGKLCSVNQPSGIFIAKMEVHEEDEDGNREPGFILVRLVEPSPEDLEAAEMISLP